MEILIGKKATLTQVTAKNDPFKTDRQKTAVLAVLAGEIFTFKLVINSTIYNRKSFVAPLRAISNKFNSLIELTV
jgi:hypothetical protein